jgi:hypothetical protein
MYYRIEYFSGTFVYLNYVHTLLFIFACIVRLKHFPRFASNCVLWHFLELRLSVPKCFLGGSQTAPKNL